MVGAVGANVGSGKAAPMMTCDSFIIRRRSSMEKSDVANTSDLETGTFFFKKKWNQVEKEERRMQKKIEEGEGEDRRGK